MRFGPDEGQTASPRGVAAANPRGDQAGARWCSMRFLPFSKRSLFYTLGHRDFKAFPYYNALPGVPQVYNLFIICSLVISTCSRDISDLGGGTPQTFSLSSFMSRMEKNLQCITNIAI